MAEGRHWVVYVTNGLDLSYKTATEADPDNWSTETDIVTLAIIAANQYGVWYDIPSNTVHIAWYNAVAAPDEVTYLMGTPNSNGTITWAAAPQVVALIPVGT